MSRTANRVLRWGGWAPFAFLALTLVMTYPAILHLGTRVLSTGPDVWTFWWSNWWVKRALTTGQNPYYSPHLFYPQGVSLTYHSFSWLNTGLWLVLEPLVGAVAAYNVTVLWVFPIAAWGMYLLVLELTGSKGASFLAGVVYAFVPYRLGHINHGHLMGTQWIPFYTVHLLRGFRDGGWRPILTATLYFILTSLVGWNLLLYAVIWTGFIAAYLWLSRGARLRRLARVAGLTLTVGIAALSPLWLPMLASPVASEETLGDVQQSWMQTDVLAYLVPSRFHPVWGQAVESVYDWMGRPKRVVCVGYVVMALLGYSLARKVVRRRTGLWWWGAVLWWFMSLGPFLKLGGVVHYGLPLPYYALSRLYLFQVLKIPDRNNLVLILPVAVIAGLAAADLLARLRGGWRAGALAALCGLTLFEYLAVPMGTQAIEIPAVYQLFAQEPDGGAIVELPIDFYDAAKRYMLYQTVHGRPLVEGHVSRRPADATAFLDSHPLLRTLYRTQEMDPQLTDVSRQLGALSDAGFRHIIVHKRLTDEAHLSRWRSWLIIKPSLEDRELLLYPTAPQYGRDFAFMAELSDGIGLIQSTLPTRKLSPEGWLECELAWGTHTAPQRDWAAELALVSSSGAVVQTIRSDPSNGWPTSQWGPDAVARGLLTMRLDPYVEAGTYSLTVGLLDAATGTCAGAPVSLGKVAIDAPLRVFALPTPQSPTDAVFGGTLRLHGYDLQRERDALRLTLYWQALRRMAVSYKVFVHVVDVASGEVMAQTDLVPREWSYPTTRWEQYEVVSDIITVALSGVPRGSYALYVGVYNPGTGVRLSVDSTTASRAELDQLRLEGVVVP